MMKRYLAPLFAITLLVASMLPAAWAANGRLLQGKQRRIKACVLVIPSMGEPLLPGGLPNPLAGPGAIPDPDGISRLRAPAANPYIFYVLNRRVDLRPDGWEFYNPAAPASASPAQAARWGIPQGTPLAQDMAVYWETLLSPDNMQALSEMDLIYIPISRAAGNLPVPTFFTETQRRILTRLADSGVTLFVDWALNAPTSNGALGGEQVAGAPTAQTWNPFFTNLDFAALNTSVPANVSPPLHPILTARFRVEDTELPAIGSPASAGAQPSQNRVVELRALQMQPTTNWVTVIPTAAAPPTQGAYLAATRYGSGFVVASAGNVGGAIAGFLGTQTQAPPDADTTAADSEDLKLLYNSVAWRDEVTAPQKNGRHTGAGEYPLQGVIQTGTYPDLMRSGGPGTPWIGYPPAGAALPLNPASPLIINDTVISYTAYRDTGGAVHSELNAFQAFPEGDFDENRYSDDGPEPGAGGPGVNPASPATNPFVDVAVGQSYDRIMGLDVPPVFGMTVGEVPDLNSPSGSQPFVFAAGENAGAFGGLYSLPAPRPKLPISDYWNIPGIAKSVPAGLGIDFRGAPGFANIPGIGAAVVSQIYAAGVFSAGSSPIFGSSQQGKMVAMQVGPDGSFAPNPSWYYPQNNQAGRMGAVAGPVTVAQMMDQGTGAIDTMVFITTVSSGDTGGAQAGGAAGDTTGKALGWVVSTRGEPLGFPRGNPQQGANQPAAGSIFVASRWLDVPPGTGAVPQQNQLIWDQTRHHEVRVLEKASGYVLARFTGASGLTLLRNGSAGQVQLPPPSGPLAMFASPQRPTSWDLERFLLLADYSPLPVPDPSANSAVMQPLFNPQTPYERGAGQNQVQPTGVAGGVSVGPDNLAYYGTGQGFMCAAEWRKGRPQFRWKIRSLEYADQTGLSTQANPAQNGYLTDYAFTAAPAAAGRVVFAARGRGGPGTIYLLESDAVIRFKLQLPAGSTLSPARARDIMLEADHGAAVPQNVKGLLADQQPWGRVPGQFVVDPDTATVTFLNMENFSLDLRQAKTASELAALPPQDRVDTGGRPAVPIRWGFRNPLAGEPSLAGNPRTAWIPLPVVAIYRSANANLGAVQTFNSGALFSGDKVLALSLEGWLHQIPLDPKSFDPQFPRDRAPNGSALNFQAAFNVGEPSLYGLPGGISRTVNVAANTGVPCLATPAVGDGVVAVSSPRGLTTFSSPNVIVADANRIVEASGDSSALAVTDVVVKDRIDLSEMPILVDRSLNNVVVNGVQRPILSERTFLSRPARVVKLDRYNSFANAFSSSSQLIPGGRTSALPGIGQTPPWLEDSYLVADTGNDRALEMTQSGRVIWELTNFQDPFGLLPSGESRKLAGPLDVQRWVEQELVPGAGLVDVIHTLIADTGNGRVLEIVDKVRPVPGATLVDFPVIAGQTGANGQPIRWYHVLVWSSQTNGQGLKLPYRSAQRIFWPDRSGGLIPVNAPGNPMVAVAPFWLPPERFVSYTMAAVGGLQVEYPETPAAPSQLIDYIRAWPQLTQEVQDRKPRVRPGGDSIVFLRGRYYLEPGGGGVNLRQSFIRESRVRSGGQVVGGESFRFGAGVVDPFIPIITDIRDELLANGAPASQQIVHRLTGVNSVQRTIRADVKFAPGDFGAGPMPRGQYFLIADSLGVWEIRMLPGSHPAVTMGLPPGQKAPFRLAWALTSDDYGRVTGIGASSAAGRRFTPFSARRLANRMVLISSRTPRNDIPPAGTPAAAQAYIGADVFLLRSSDYFTATERVMSGFPAPYDRSNLLAHGWRPDLFAQVVGPGVPKVAPSIRWRAGQQVDADFAPTLRSPQLAGTNPTELRGSYQPVQPADADISF